MAKKFASRTQKRNRTLIAAAVITAVFAVVYAIVYASTRPPEEIVTEDPSLIVSSRDSAELTELRWVCSGEHHAFERNLTDGTWSRENDPDYPPNTLALNEMAANISAITAERMLSSEESAADYGLDDPYITISASYGGNTDEYIIGDRNEITGCYYLKKNGSDSIYLVPSAIIPYFTMSAVELIEKETMPVIATTDIKNVTVTLPEAPAPLTLPLDDAAAMLRVTALTLYSVVDYKPDEAVKAAYGLDDANAAVIGVDYTVTVSITASDTLTSSQVSSTAGIETAQSYTVKVGSVCPGDDDYRYVMYNDSPIVYKMRAENIDIIMASAAAGNAADTADPADADDTSATAQ